jgi:hypothetical protein
MAAKQDELCPIDCSDEGEPRAVNSSTVAMEWEGSISCGTSIDIMACDEGVLCRAPMSMTGNLAVSDSLRTLH